MVNFDLRKLSAPIEELRSDVSSAYKRLDAKWQNVVKTLASLPIPCDVGYKFYDASYDEPDYFRLEWRKWKGKKRICIVHYYFELSPRGGPEECESVTPYDEWGGEQRMEMLRHVDKLFEAAATQTKKFIEKTLDLEEPS